MLGRITEFLVAIGLDVRLEPLSGNPTFLPGIEIQDGCLVVDEAKLLSAGDVLHEAGHLALLKPEERRSAGGDMGDDAGLEMGAIAWSYAAAVHLNIPPSILFHAEGYKGGSEALIENFEAGRGVGVPILEWLGLSVTERTAEARGVAAYPAMLRWLREADSTLDSLH